MQFNFDLISDLHVESWNRPFSWEGQPTAPYCIVAGDVARDRAMVIDTLEELARHYAGVFYIDGNSEHKDQIQDLDISYQGLEHLIGTIPNVVFMLDNVVIINGVALLASNAWWTFDFDPNLDVENIMQEQMAIDQIRRSDIDAIEARAISDARYLINSVEKLQTQQDVKSIVIVTHTVPAPWIIEHDLSLINDWRFNTMGNSFVESLIDKDTENKIKMWCFGHYHKPVDVVHNGIRYINNCRGNGLHEFNQTVYWPKRLTIEV